MSQTKALMTDAYRELNAKKLFWVSMALSLLIVVVVAAIGLDRNGISVFGFELSGLGGGYDTLTDEQLADARTKLYQTVFDFVGVQVWLTWAAIILAIFSTAGIFPDLMSTGAIDTLVTKPISRLRLFLTKYLLGLGFVGLQVAVFSVGAFLVVGVRAGAWEPKLFLAIPIVLLFFSYLYAVCVLVGVMTRSTLIAVILTGVVWVLVFGLNAVDSIVLQEQASAALQIEMAEKRLEHLKTLPTEGQSKAERSEDADNPDSEPADINTREGYIANFGDEASLQNEIDTSLESAAGSRKWRGYFFWIKTPLPKTSETADLMSRVLTDTEEFDDVAFDPAQPMDEFYGGGPMGRGPYQKLLEKKAYELQTEQRSWVWILLTSILFEVVVVGLAAWLFCRRDY